MYIIGERRVGMDRKITIEKSNNFDKISEILINLIAQ
jgi:hypothetical protein